MRIMRKSYIGLIVFLVMAQLSLSAMTTGSALPDHAIISLQHLSTGGKYLHYTPGPTSPVTGRGEVSCTPHLDSNCNWEIQIQGGTPGQLVALGQMITLKHVATGATIHANNVKFDVNRTNTLQYEIYASPTAGDATDVFKIRANSGNPTIDGRLIFETAGQRLHSHGINYYHAGGDGLQEVTGAANGFGNTGDTNNDDWWIPSLPFTPWSVAIESVWCGKNAYRDLYVDNVRLAAKINQAITNANGSNVTYAVNDTYNTTPTYGKGLGDPAPGSQKQLVVVLANGSRFTAVDGGTLTIPATDINAAKAFDSRVNGQYFITSAWYGDPNNAMRRYNPDMLLKRLNRLVKQSNGAAVSFTISSMAADLGDPAYGTVKTLSVKLASGLILTAQDGGTLTIPAEQIVRAAIAVLTTTQIAALTPDQVKALTQPQIQGLTTTPVNQIEALIQTQIQTLTPIQLGWLAPMQVQEFTTNQIPWFSQDQLSVVLPNLTMVQRAALSSDQIKSLPTAKLVGLLFPVSMTK